jgi:hypothetical protein
MRSLRIGAELVDRSNLLNSRPDKGTFAGTPFVQRSVSPMRVEIPRNLLKSMQPRRVRRLILTLANGDFRPLRVTGFVNCVRGCQPSGRNMLARSDLLG